MSNFKDPNAPLLTFEAPQQFQMVQQPIMMNPQAMPTPQQGIMMNQQGGMMPQGMVMMPQGMMMAQQGYPQQGMPFQNPYNPQGGFPLQPQPTNIVIKENLPSNANGQTFPTRIKCPHCSQTVRTFISVEAGTSTWIMCCFLWCWTGFLCCLPFCIDSCQDTIHICSSCQQKVGITEYQIC